MVKNIIYDIVIIGGGPAGISAGIYGARQNFKILLITKSFGGQVAGKAVAIENYPGFEEILGKDLIEKFENHLRKQKVEIKFDEVIGITKNTNLFLVTIKNEKIIQAKTVIIASGAENRSLEIPGEKEFLGKGVSYCAVCDGILFVNKSVAVIGGGNAGFESAILLSNYVEKIYILEYGSEVKADKINQQILKKANKAKIITNVALKRINGKEFVESITYENVINNRQKTIPVNGVFVEIGRSARTSFVRDLVEFNKQNEIKVKFETYETKTPGLFVAGDANIGQYKQIITACGEGAKAALSAYNYIRKQ